MSPCKCKLCQGGAKEGKGNTKDNLSVSASCAREGLRRAMET